MIRTILIALYCSLFLPIAHAQTDPAVIFDMDTLRHKPTEITDKDKKKVPAGTAELVDGKFGKAVKFTFIQGASGGFMTAPVRPTPLWAEGASSDSSSVGSRR